LAGLASINIRFSADLKDFSTKMANANRSIQKLGKKMKAVGQNLSIGVTAPIVALGALSVKTFATFEQAMANVAAVSGATGSSFAALEKSALDLGAATQFTAEQVAQLQLNYSKLGFSPDEILQVTAATLDLAVATGEDLATSATVAASTLRGFGLEANEMGRVIDVMASSFSKSALDLSKFQTAMAILAPVAKNAGVGIEEATSYLSILTDRGVDASSAGSALRNIFLTLAGSGETLQGSMTRIATSTNKNKTAFETFGKLGATVATIMAENSAEAKTLQTAYEGSAGAAKSMAAIVGGTTQGALLRMRSAIEGAAISLGEQLAPFVEKVSILIGDLANRFKELSPETKKIIVVVAGLAAAIGPLLVVLGVLMSSVIPGLITAFGGLRAGMLLLRTGFIQLTATMAANPFGLLAVAIAAIASYFLFFNKNVDDTIEKQSLLASVNDTAAKSIANEKAKLNELLFIARDENIQKSARIKAIKELNKLSPKHLGDLTLEKINTDDARIAIELYNTELLKTARIKAAQSKLQELQSKIIDLQIASENASVKSAKAVNKLKEEAVSLEDQLRVRAIEKAGSGANVTDIYSVQVDKLKQQEQQLLKIIAANQTINKVVASGGGGTDDPVEGRKKATTVGENLSAVGVAEFDITSNLTTESEKLDTILTGIKGKFESFQGVTQIFGDAIGNSFMAMSSKIVGALQTGNTILDAFVGSVINSLANLAAAFVQQLLVEKLFSTAKKSVDFGRASSNAIVIASSAAAAMGPFGAIALPGLIAAQVGMITGAFAGIAAFANGGMVGGSSFSGDKLFARVNSGEMILNKGQQSNMAGMMDSNRGNVNVQLGVGTKLVGRDLIFFLREEAIKLTRTQG